MAPSFSYPTSSYLLRRGTDCRFRVLDAVGLPDAAACAVVAKLLPVAAGLTEAERAGGARVVARLQKALSSGGAALDQRFGFALAIEVPMGGIRSGVSPDGTAWSQPMIGAGYGFLPGTIELDREPVDVFAGPDAAAPLVYAVTQLRPDGTLDERKLLLGFPTAQEAIQVFLANGPAWRMGEVHAFPIGLLRGLLGYEAVAPGAIVKALDGLGGDNARSLVALGPEGLLIAGVEQVQDARCRKGAIGVSTFEGGGAKLPAQAGARPRRVKADQGQFVADGWTVKGDPLRLTRTIESCTTYKGAPVPLATRPELADHPAVTAPLSWAYDAPMDVGGWIGAIEPEDEAWICFVGIDGTALLWTTREPNGAVVGDPVGFTRPDIATDYAAALAAAAVTSALGERGTWKRDVRMLPISKAMTATTPVEKRIVIGVVLEPEPFNGAGDGHHETYSAGEIELAAHNYCASFLALNDAHGRFLTREQIAVVETYIAPCDFTLDGSTVRAGSWVLAARIIDPALWARVLTGELRAWSIEGYSERYCTTCDLRMHLVKDALRGEAWACPGVAMGRHR